MEAFPAYASAQYGMVQESRKTLLEYCQTISPPDLLKDNSAFGRGSIRNLLVHVANIYELWIGKNGLGRDIAFTEYGSKKDIKAIIGLFDNIDLLVYDFIQFSRDAGVTGIEYEINGVRKNATPLRLFTHTVTHEFHHKGQILSLSRHLGYIPVDTDIIR